MKLLLYPEVEPARLQRIESVANDVTLINATSLDEALLAMPQADAFFGKMTPALLARAESLRWVQAPTASLEHYMFPELVAHRCVLTNMRGIFSDVIADQVMGYVICFARHLHTYIRNQQTRLWQPHGGEAARVSFTTGPGIVNNIDRAHKQLSDTTLGVVGFGSIGAEVARRASAFGMRILAVDARPKNVSSPIVWPLERLPDLLAQSDFVVLAAPHTPETAGWFTMKQWRLMKPGSYFINVGRGAVVVLQDLVQALQEERLAGAALDVFEIEPLPADHPLWGFANVIITPHVAGYSPRIAERHLDVLLQNIKRFLRGDELLNQVDKNAWF